jgi:hypothetical protein
MLLILNSLTMCRFCQQNEEDDPSEEFEEYLACSVCGDGGKFSSHRLHSVSQPPKNAELKMCLIVLSIRAMMHVSGQLRSS